MPDTTQTTDLDFTIKLLQQDFTSIDLVVAIATIERWERQLQDTNLFGSLSGLKQALLDGNATSAAKSFEHLSKEISTFAASVDDQLVAAKVEEIGRLLAQASSTLT